MNESAIPSLPCMCASIRRTARALSQVYEQALRPYGLRGSQFTILQVLSVGGEMTQGKLGEVLAMDSTTLTRTLAIMRRNGWILERRGTDKRERLLRLGAAGEKLLQRALASWQKVQSRVEGAVGSETWSTLLKLTNELTKTAISEGESR